MRLITATLSFAISLCLSGCINSVRVSNSSGLKEPPKGIPFYAKTGVCKQQTIWLEPQYTISLALKSPTDPTPESVVLSRSEFLRDDVQRFIGQPADSNDWKQFFTSGKFKGPQVVDEGSDKTAANIAAAVGNQNWIMSSNTGTVETVVDYSTVFYLNSARPLAGTTQIETKFASDGTLTDASAQVNDQTISAIGTAISSVVGAVASAAKALTATSETKGTVKFKPTVYQHTHYKYAPDLIAPGKCVAVSGGVTDGSFTTAEATPTTSTKPADDAKKDSIGITGSINFPAGSFGLTGPPPPQGAGITGQTPPVAPKKQ